MPVQTATEKIRGLSGALLDEVELSQVKEIVEDKDIATIKTLCAALQLKYAPADTLPDGVSVGDPLPEAKQGLLKLTRYDLGFFYDRSPEGTVKVKGGKEGDDFDVERDREDTRERLRLRLGLPAISTMRRQMMARQSSGPVSQTVRTKRVMR
jgi:hypothetical protein